MPPSISKVDIEAGSGGNTASVQRSSSSDHKVRLSSNLASRLRCRRLRGLLLTRSRSLNAEQVAQLSDRSSILALIRAAPVDPLEFSGGN